MSIETFSPLPLNTFGTWITLLDPSDVPPGMSPNLADVEFFPAGCARARGSSRNSGARRRAANQRAENLHHHESRAAAAARLDSLGNLYKETSPGVLSLLVGRRGQARTSISHPPRISAANTWLSATASSARTCRASTTTCISIASARSARREGPAVADSGTRQHFAGRASVRGGVRHAPGILDRAFAAGFVDRRGQRKGERDEYSHRPVERGAAAAGLHRVGRREFLQRARHDDDQRQHHHFAHRRFHRHDSAFRHEHGLSLQPDRTARAARRGGLRRAAFLVGRARQHGQLAQPHFRRRLGRVRQRPPARLAARSVFRRAARSREAVRRGVGRRVSHHRRRRHRRARHDRAERHHGRERRSAAS